MNKFRYEKQIKLKGFGLPAQQFLQNSKVLIIGAGGLGTPCAQYLNGAGVGTIGLIDDDIISLSNLPRQTLYNENEVGLHKIEVLFKKLKLQNPDTNLICYKEFLVPENALLIIENYDLVIDASDNFGTRYLVNDSCVILNKPFIYGAVYEFEGQVSVLNYMGGPTYRCLFAENDGPDESLNCDDNGILGVLPALIGTYQAIEAIKIITSIGTVLSGQLLIIDTLSQTHFKIAVLIKPENKNIVELKSFYSTPTCTNAVQLIDGAALRNWLIKDKNVQLIDVRTADEFATNSLPGAKNIPLADLDNRKVEIDFSWPVVTICATGNRSKQAALILVKVGNIGEVFSLKGGLSSL